MTASRYTVGMMLPPHTLRAHNDAAASANKIHDDTVAAQYGFRGGLVPGVSVYAYMTYPLVQQCGQDWLAHGTAQVRFAKPLYDGDAVTVTSTVRAVTEDSTQFDLSSVNADGIDCGIGTAAISTRPAAPPDGATIPALPPTGERVPVSWEAIVVGQPLPTRTLLVDTAMNTAYARQHSDDLPIYQRAHGPVHPGLLLHQCNRVFSEHFILGPWIHVASDITMYHASQVGEAIEIRAAISDKFEKKGHEFAVLDVFLLANGQTAQHVTHTCIFRPRLSPRVA